MSAMPFVTETFAPLWRGRTYAAALYLLLALPLGLIAFLLLVVGAALGVGLAVVWVGVPILLGLLAASRAFGAFDRGLANRLLGTAIQRSGRPALARRLDLGAGQGLVRSRTTWRSILWLSLRFPLSLLGFTLPLASAAVALGLIVAPFSNAFTGAHRVLGGSAATAGVCVAGGLAMAVLTAHLDRRARLGARRARACACSGPRAPRSSRCSPRAASGPMRAPTSRASCTTPSATR